ncbi:general secretion pathway protein M [Sphingobium sp. JAI105]|uniref:type II secretion system protein GspM n=1 Tax=Sphingobium sp. JAI105 TaxID=2787715 RepID=UPI0018C98FA4|nr:type II secretion system protein M [Sphingobium sp. JAI105]MBG6116970.1 general secretion pathway protein M [Sphingobium sp. JAI105]
MMERMQALWAERSSREQVMLGVMFALLAGVLLWFGVAVPLDRAQRSARDNLVEATERNAAVRTAVQQLKALPSRPAAGGPAAPLDQLVGQGAGEAGLTLERAQAQGPDRMEIAIAAIRPVALFSWIAVLEAQGVRVETMSARPAPTAGSLSVQAVLVRGSGQ